MQKPLLAVLIALSMPLTNLSAEVAWAASDKKTTSIDYGAGSTLGGTSSAAGETSTSSASTTSSTSANSTAQDANFNNSSNGSAEAGSGMGADTAGGAPGSAPTTADPSTNTTNSASPGADGSASLESIWTEAPATSDKSKSKKKSHEKSRQTNRTAKNKSQSKDSVTTTTQPASQSTGAAAGGSTTADADLQPASGATSGAAIPAQSGSILDKPVTLGGITPAAAPEAVETLQTSPRQTQSEAAQSSAGAAPVRHVPVSHPPDTIFSTTKTSVGEHAAPLCQTHAFFQSELIRTVSWPGVGPFRGDTDPNDLSDPQENKLSLQTSGDKVTSAELILLHQPGNPQGFVNLEMVLDFMLEALGAKDRKINEFNGFLEKNKEILTKNKATEEKPLKTGNGPYVISIAGSGKNNESSYLIQVRSKRSAEEAERAERAEKAERPERPEHTTGSESASQGEDAIANGSGATRSGGVAVVAAATTGAANTPKIAKRPADATKPKTASTAPTKEVSKENGEETTGGGASGDTLKQEFADTIRNWQTVKKEAVKTRDVSELSKLLSGKALDKQTVAIGWLAKEKKYYELTPKGVIVDKYQEISPSPKRYAVYAHVKEFSRLLDEGTNKLNKEGEDQYNVNYTIERTGDHWTIYDSQVIQQAGQPGASTKAATKPKK